MNANLEDFEKLDIRVGKILSMFEKFTRFGLASAKANHAADILAVIEDDALRNAREFYSQV